MTTAGDRSKVENVPLFSSSRLETGQSLNSLLSLDVDDDICDHYSTQSLMNRKYP